MTLKEKLGLGADPVFLMDGTAFIYRGFYASRHMRRSDGFPTNSIVIVARVLLRILRGENPRYFLFALDGGGRNFRYDLYSEYKANREAMPEDLSAQIEPVKRIARALGLRLETAENCEADDCIASLAARFSRERPVVIVSGDKDLKQCLGDNVFMWDPGSKEDRLLTAADFEAESGVRPAQWPDVQALVGDSSDNIPGIRGIGPKMARQIFETCANLEDIRARISDLPVKIQEKLKSGDNLEKMFLWRDLATLRLDACPGLELRDLAVGEVDLRECGEITEEFELFALRREIAAMCGERKKAEPAGRAQHSLLAEKKQPESQAGESAWPPAPRTDVPPDCAGRVVAVIWPEKDALPRVAVEAPGAGGGCGGEIFEWEWTGDMESLRNALGCAAALVVEDLKALLRRFSASRGALSPLMGAGAPRCIDLGLASYLLAPEDGDYSWKRLSGRWREQLRCQDKGPAILALAMARALEKNLRSDGLETLYRDMELPLAPVLARMEERGVVIDPRAFQKFLDDVSAESEELMRKVFAEAGEEFNIRSSRQLGVVLFEHLGLEGAKKTPGGLPSTSQLSLERLAASSPVVEDILQFRKLDKMRSTYLDPFPKLMDAHNRIHTTFNQKATSTGRLSSSNPNLQNIPVRGSLGKRMRSCFIAAPGKMLLAADYSQIELRILAHCSGDRHLLEAFRNGEDIHARTASLVFEAPAKEITADQRRMAKTINFGLLYGMGARKLANELKISQQRARDFIDRYFERLSGVRQFYQKVLESARQQGYVNTLAGRRRWLPEINSRNGNAAAQAERQAVNAVIQGTAADVIKLAMLTVAHDRELAEMGAAMLLQVHDELLLEAPEDVAENACRRVAELMRAARPGGIELEAPLVVDWGIGKNWGEAH